MPSLSDRTIRLPSGQDVPALGQGTWFMGDRPDQTAEEIKALRRGIDLGMTLIDTAEMYGNGAAEVLVGEAIRDCRADVFLVSKVLPNRASQEGTIKACEGSLQRLGTDRIDLYLLHWRGQVPLAETIEAFEQLVSAGMIRHWGVSNLDTSDMQELVGASGGNAVQTDQILYNLSRRGIEFDLLPWCRSRNIPVMAYSPIEQGRLLAHPTLNMIAKAHNATSAQIALAWLLRQEGVIAIPKAGRLSHVEENRRALNVTLSDDDLAALDQAFHPPSSPTPLEML
ncbi:MAG: aldo/keto reductase [Alphaproteobacteria bacterium]|nr:aldo/keto reductase [Alphaproteobacteria bacterium]